MMNTNPLKSGQSGVFGMSPSTLINRQAKILLVEDSQDSQMLVNRALGTEFFVKIVSTLEKARHMVDAENFDLLLIDIGLPDGLGYELCSYLQNNYSKRTIPIILLSGRSEMSDKLLGFEYGADDYIVKPFEPAELFARVKSKLDKAAMHKARNEVYSDQNLSVEPDSLKAFLISGGQKEDLNLTPIEFKILLLLMKNPGRSFTREDLIQYVWPDSPNMAPRGVDTHISHIRRKLGDKSGLIHSSYGRGYAYQSE